MNNNSKKQVISFVMQEIWLSLELLTWLTSKLFDKYVIGGLPDSLRNSFSAARSIDLSTIGSTASRCFQLVQWNEKFSSSWIRFTSPTTASFRFVCGRSAKTLLQSETRLSCLVDSVNDELARQNHLRRTVFPKTRDNFSRRRRQPGVVIVIIASEHIQCILALGSTQYKIKENKIKWNEKKIKLN